MTRVLFALLATLLLATPLAAAQAQPADTADSLPCPSPLVVGLVAYAVCMALLGVATAEAGACIAWRLVWGQHAACPT